MTDVTDPIVVEQEFSVSRSELWKAITEPSQMVNWFFKAIPDFEPEPGFETKFNVNTGEADFVHVWKVLEAVPDTKVVIDWRYQGFDGIGKVIFEVFDGQRGSKLRITNEGLESFPQDRPEFTRESCVGGWEFFQGQLKNWVEKGKAGGF